MQFKMKLIAATCAAIGSVSAYAGPCATYTPGDPAYNALLDAACKVTTPDVTYYVSGASAQQGAMNDIGRLWFTNSNDPIQVVGSQGDITAHVGYLGIRNGKKTLVIYRNSGGSGAGVRQLQAKTTAAYNPGITSVWGGIAAGAENSVMNVAAGTSGTISGGAGTWSTSAPANAVRVPDAALSDQSVVADATAGTFYDLVPGILPTGDTTKWYEANSLVQNKTAIQGFGIAVNQKLYKALQKKNNREGILPNSCVPADPAVDLTAACQPTMAKTDYQSLFAVEGSIKSAGELLQTTDATPLTIYPRTDTSGTQASARLFFLNNATGSVGHLGALNPVTSANNVAGVFTVSPQGSSSTLVGLLNTSGIGDTDYRIGVVSFEFDQSTRNMKFVKLDGVSGNFTWDFGTGTLVADTKQRQQFASGAYPFAYEMYAMRTPGATADQIQFYTDLVTLLSSPGNSNNTGTAYLPDCATNLTDWNKYDSTAAAPANRTSRVIRNGNAASPLYTFLPSASCL